MKKNITLFALLLCVAASAQNWRKLPFDLSTFNNSYNDLYFHSENNGHLVGDNWSYLQTSDAGLSWIKKDIRNLDDSVFYRVIFLNDSVGFIQGQSDIYKTRDSGDNWTKVGIGVYRNQIGIWKEQVYAYGDMGFGSLYFARYFESEDSFDVQHGAWPMYTLEKLVYLGDSTLIVAKDTGKIYKSTDLGKSFELMSENKGWRQNLKSRTRDIYFKNQDTGFVSYLSYGFAHTTDGGETWTTDSVYYNYNISRFSEWKNKVYFVTTTASFLNTKNVSYYSGVRLKNDTSFNPIFIQEKYIVASSPHSIFLVAQNALWRRDNIKLGIPATKLRSLQCYPNPSTGKFNIELPPASNSDVRIEVTNSLGQEMPCNLEINGSNLHLSIDVPGVYYARILDENGQGYFGKLIVN